MADVKYELSFEAEAEVIPGPLTRIRVYCEQVIDSGVIGRDAQFMAADILEIINEG